MASAPATARQLSFIRDLLHGRKLDENVASRVRNALVTGAFDKTYASQTIDELARLPKVDYSRPVYDDGPASPEVFKKIEADAALPQADSSLGLFEHDGKIYKIQWNKQRTSQYAAEMIYDVATIEEFTRTQRTVKPRYRYAPRVRTQLRESMRLRGTRAAELQAAFTSCIVCGHALSNPTSVSRGIGPVCWSRLAH